MQDSTKVIQDMGDNTLLYLFGALIVVLIAVVFMRRGIISIPGINITQQADNTAKVKGKENKIDQDGKQNTNDTDVDGDGNTIIQR